MTRLAALVSACTAAAGMLCMGAPCAAQDAPASIARALRILREMEQVLDAVLARQEAARTQAARPSAPPEGNGWTLLFDGEALGRWKRTEFAGGGEVRVERRFRGDGPAIVIGMGATLSGIHWTGDVPRTNYEIALEGMKLEGNDFWCGLTFPVGDSHASLILGGWGGGVVGISSIDNRDASENETTRYMDFPRDRWRRVLLRVTPNRLEAWLDDQKIVDQDIRGRKISLRPGEISRSVPLGIATYMTTAAHRNIRIRQLRGPGG